MLQPLVSNIWVNLREHGNLKAHLIDMVAITSRYHLLHNVPFG